MARPFSTMILLAVSQVAFRSLAYDDAATDEALRFDDECPAGDPECGLSLLQLRAHGEPQTRSEAPAEGASAAGAAATAAGSKGAPETATTSHRRGHHHGHHHGRHGHQAHHAHRDLGRPELRRAEEEASESGNLGVAFVGNSYLYFNDLPRLFQAFGGGPGQLRVGDCLKGGQSWSGLLRRGNGMQEKFASPNALLPDGTYDVGAATVQELLDDPRGWDFVVLNTYSQEAARPERRRVGLRALEELAPMLEKAQARGVLLVTAAYREHAKGSDEIGTWEDFTRKQSEGFAMYQERLASLVSKERAPLLADANRAFEIVREEDEALWRDLFHIDDFHPSALGTYLQANVLYCAISGGLPPESAGAPEDAAGLFARARRMLPPKDPVGRLPSAKEMAYLRGVALRVAGQGAG